MWFYDIPGDYWFQVMLANPIPSRYSFAYVSFEYAENFYFAVVGGKSNSDADILRDFYLYNVTSNQWISMPGIQICFGGLGISGAQLQFHDGRLYLFGGSNINRDDIKFYESVCEYPLGTISISGPWQLIDTGPNFINAIRSGSCVHEGFLYNVFGFSFNNTVPMTLDTIYRLDLSNPENGWEDLTVSGCDSSLTTRNSFGYAYSNGSLFINGGFSELLVLNTVIRLDLNNSDTDVKCEALFNESDWPNRRNGASLVYASEKFILFGGQDNGNIFSDVWYIDVALESWIAPITFGDYPPPRYRHAAAAQGKYMLIWGGIGMNNVILQDFYLLDTETMLWTLISSVDGALPTPAYSSCMVIQLPEIFIVGGVEESHITLNLWRFDLSTMLFTKLYNFNISTDTGVFGHGCYIDNINGHQILSTIFGSITLLDTPFNGVIQFNLSSTTIKPVITRNSNSSLAARSHFSYYSLNSEYILIAGGERYLQEFFDDVIIVNKNSFEFYPIVDMDFPMYYSAFAFFNNSMFIFSGFSSNGVSVKGPSNNYSISIELVNLTTDVPGFDLYCSLGLENRDGYCQLCKPGTYSPSQDTEPCIECPAGTYSKISGATDFYQCTPCPNGTYSEVGSSYCIACTPSQTCYIGSEKSMILSSSDVSDLEEFRDYKEQPSLYEPPNIIDIIMILWITSFSLIVLFCIIFIFSPRLQVFLSFNDIFKNAHFEVHATADGSFVNRDHTIQPSKIGGCCTIITVILLLSLACNSIITYTYTNENQDVILVPIDSLTEDQDFTSNSLDIDLMFSSYRGNCSWKSIHLNLTDNFHVNSKKLSNSPPFCHYKIDGKLNDIVKSNDYFSFFFNEPNSYTSDINVRLTTRSSIPAKYSSVTQYIQTDNTRVLRGVINNIFYYSFLPAYYKESGIFKESTNLGYVLSSSISPSMGSTVTTGQIGLSSGLGIQINLDRIEIGITTYKYPRVELFDFVIKFMNDFPGTIVLVGFILWFIEYFANMCKGRSSGRLGLIRRRIASIFRRNDPQNDYAIN